jgi:hypothetical protein
MFTVNGNDASWQRAQGKAAEDKPEVQINGFGDYKVAGSLGGRYAVTIEEDENGTHIACDCLAGTHDKPCYHAARALRVHSSFLTVSAPVRDKRLAWLEQDLKFIRRRAEELGGDFEVVDDICRAVRSALQSLGEYEVELLPATDEVRATRAA